MYVVRESDGQIIYKIYFSRNILCNNYLLYHIKVPRALFLLPDAVSYSFVVAAKYRTVGCMSHHL
jgi:hypothetical protein